MSQQFKFIVNLTKGYKSDDGRLFVEGIASGTDLDLTGERMSPEAIKSMAESLQKGIVEFRSEHSSDWDSMFGEVIGAIALCRGGLGASRWGRQGPGAYCDVDGPYHVSRSAV